MSVNQPVIADAAQREAALDPTRSFIVQAPAGSGKTELLTQRLLVLLASVEEPEEVVAMTFTRKAAAEMRHRVFNAIRSALDEQAPTDAHKQRTWHLARAALARSRDRGWRLDENPQRLRILTIDALCAQIAQQAPLRAGFGGRVQVTEYAEPLYREAARAVIASLDDDPTRAAPVARVLRHFDNRTAMLEQQLVNLLARREQWMSLVVDGARGEQARELLERTLTWVIDDALARVNDALPAELKASWVESAAYATLTLAPDHPLQQLRTNGWPTAAPEQLPQWLALIALVLRQDDGWRATVDKRSGFPAGKGEPQLRKQAHLQLIAALQDVPQLHALLVALRALPDARYADAQWDVLQALLDTLLLAAAHLRLSFVAGGKVDFGEVAARAVAALGDATGPSDLALRLDYRIRHLLVDEFQDTSQLQWSLLQRLTAGWQTGDGRTLFVVGDPMQSIYRFREADVGLFLRAADQGIEQLPLESLKLTSNFRSQAGIVDWVNAAFTQVFPQQDDANRGAVRYSRAVPVREPGEGRSVQVHALLQSNRVAEARCAVELVADSLRTRPDDSIAVLVRSRDHLSALVPLLREAGIGYRAVDIEGLADRPVISDLYALTRALLHPLDRVAWLAVLRAPWCGLRLEDLHRLLQDWPQSRSVWGALQDPDRSVGLSADARERLAPVLPVLSAALAEQGRVPLRRWVESTWFALGGPACAGSDAALDDAATFLDCLQDVSTSAIVEDFTRLDLALAALRASPDPTADGRVSLMTIHKSKGLEFDTVIVPGLDRGTRSDDPPPVAWTHLTDVAGETRLVLAPVHATGDERDATYDYVRTLLAEKQQFEDARLLYVAATRARRHLHLIACAECDAEGQVRSPAPRSLLARLWPAVQADFEGAPRQEPPAAAPLISDEAQAPPLRRRVDRTPLPLAPGLPPPPADPVAPQDVLRFDWAGETARCVGVVYHRWMQFIAEDDIAAWPSRRVDRIATWIEENLLREGVPLSHLADAVAKVVRGLRNTLDDPRGRWLLDRTHGDAASELALQDVQSGRLRRLVIDRSFVDAEGQRWIVDFKTGAHQGGDAALFVQHEALRYRAQLMGYVSAMRQLDSRPVRAALYLPLMDDPALRWVELDD